MGFKFGCNIDAENTATPAAIVATMPHAYHGHSSKRERAEIALPEPEHIQ